MSAGITDSPGDSIAGTTSPAPFGPGTLTIPLANFLTPRPGIIIPGLFIAKFLAAPAAEVYAAISLFIWATSAVNVCVKFACV